MKRIPLRSHYCIPNLYITIRRENGTGESWAKDSYPIYVLIFGFFVGEVILKSSNPRVGTLIFNCAIGFALLKGGWQLNLKVSWLARVVFLLGVLWLGYLFLHYVTAFNDPQF